MPELPLFNTNATHWTTWLIPGVGLFGALLTLLTGRLVLSRRRAVPAAVPAEAPAYDPFEKGSVTERRTTQRREGNPIEVLISVGETTKEPVRGWVTDRSMGGVCLLLHDEVAAGTVLRIKPRNGPFGTPWVDVEVRICKQERAGYEVGCRFVKTPPFGVFLLFG